MGLEFGLISSDMTFDTSEPLHFGKFQTDDVHPQRRPLTPAEILIYSSNIGSAKIAKLATADQINEFWVRLGLYDNLDLPLLERTTTKFPARFGEAEQITTSYGHGIATSPMHFLSAAAAIVNGGEYYRPSLFPVERPIGQRVVSPETSSSLRAMLRQVVERGTGKNGEADGYYVIGKTGSADKSIAGGYSADKIIASFVAAFPQDRPRYAVMVMLDEPQATEQTHGLNYSGWNAAPLTAKIIERAAPILGIMPQSPELAALNAQAAAMPRLARGHEDAPQ
jgi:cell division protein FtsI (penicillin-binding protein 3)